MFEFEIIRDSVPYGDCPCDEAYEVEGRWFVSFDDIESLLTFIQKCGDAIINKELKWIHILDENDE